MNNLPKVGEKIRINKHAKVYLWKEGKPVMGRPNHTRRFVTVRQIEQVGGKDWIIWRSSEGLMCVLAY